jgi:hypothetical protein
MAIPLASFAERSPQRLEATFSLFIEHHCFHIQHCVFYGQLLESRGEGWKLIRPVLAVAGEEPTFMESW